MPDKSEILVIIDGIEMESEAWELLRLFFSAGSIKFINLKDIPDLPGNFDKSFFLYVKAEENENAWSCEVKLFRDPTAVREVEDAAAHQSAPLSACGRRIDHSELDRPGGSLFRSRKILVGACIYEILSRLTNRRLPYGSLTGVRPVKLAVRCLEDGMGKDDTVSHLVKLTDMDSRKASLLYDIAEVEEPWVKPDKRAAHLYIGIPFCASRCLYCSFTAYSIRRYKDLVIPYLDALRKEIRLVAQWAGGNQIKIGSVYIGGGTPTSIDAGGLNRLLNELNGCFDLNGAEFTVEAGRPDTITKEKLDIMRDMNVSRISINPQTMNLSTLRLIGRNHTPEDIEEKFYMARETGFDNINMDIIAGLPGEDGDMFRNTLNGIERMSPESLTVHTMAVKRASRLREEKFPISKTPDEAVEAMIGDAYQSALKMGMRPYYLYRQKNILANLENTGYAKPGYECLYNIHTMEERQTVIALGAGAVSKFVFPDENRIKRIFNLKDVALYIQRIDEMLERKKKMFDDYI